MILFLVGAVSLLAQVVLLRELNVAFYGVELVYLVALAAWLAGTAAGAALLPGRAASRPGAAPALLAAAAFVLPLEVALVRGSRLLLGGVPGAYLPLEHQVLVLLLATVPLACLFGLAFRWAAGHHVSTGGRLARAYAVECAGAAVAGLACTVAFRAGAPTFTVAAATSVIALSALAVHAGRRRRLVVACLVVAGVLGLFRADRFDRHMTRWTHPWLVETLDTPYSRVSITRNGLQVSVFENDVLTYESETADNEALPHLTTLQHPAPARILLLGGSAEQIDRELAKHHPVTFHQVEIDGPMVEATRRALGQPAGLDGLRLADPREFLRAGRQEGEAAAAEAYDVIVVAMPDPVSGLTGRFYTREFFAECRARLAPDGVIGFRLQIPETYVTPVARLRAASVARAVRTVFPYVEFLPAPTTVVVASAAPLPGAEVLVHRLGERAIATRLVSAAYIHYLYTNDRRQALAETLPSARVPVHRDAQPVSYLYASVGWLSKFVPSLIGADAAALARPSEWPARWRWGPLVLVVGLLAASRARPWRRRATVAWAAGLAGMALETVVLLDFQAKRGALFEDLGGLMTAFMVGSALGAWRLAPAWGAGGAGEGARREPGALDKAGGAHSEAEWLPRRMRLRLAALLLALTGCGLVCTWLVRSGAVVGLAGSALFLAATGGAVAGVFACASAAVPPGDDRAMGRLYAADVLGGCLGSLAASLVLVPLVGLEVTAALAAGVALLGLVDA